MVTEVAGLQELAQVHDRVEQLLEELGSAIAANDMARIQQLRVRFDEALRTHFEAEEQLIIPALARLNERDARVIVLEHRHLIHRWSQLCGALDRGTASSFQIRAFGDELKAHADNEDRVFYQFDVQCQTGSAG